MIAVILGNRLNDDGSTTSLMNKRLELAKQIDDELCPDYIICSGGIANPKAGRTEASVMVERLIAMGIDANKLIAEDKSHTTLENAIFSAKIIKKLGDKHIVICTTHEHMYRWFGKPLSLFKHALGCGYNIEGYCDAVEETK